MSARNKKAKRAQAFTDPAAQKRAGPGGNPFYSGLPYASDLPTMEKIKQWFGPPRTLGAPPDTAEEMILAMDSRLEGTGVYSLIQHAFQLGQPPMANGFIGYSALSFLKQNGLVSACVETVADDMLREWIELDGGEDGENEGTAAVERAVDDFRLRQVFREAATLTRYFGGCLIYIDTDAPDTLALPLDISDKSAELGPGRLRGFKVIEPVNIFPGSYNSSDPLAPDYFEPGSWWVLGREVHASRFIKISAGNVPLLLKPAYNFFGIPHAQILWDYVLHFQKDRTSTSRLLGKFSDMVLKTNMHEVLMQSAATNALDSRVRYMVETRSNDGIFAIDKESEDIVKVETPLSGVTDIVRQDLEIICAINRTPAVKILGISPAGFNATGESDIRNYYDHIASQQEAILHDGIAKALDCVQLHVSGRVNPELTFHFRELGGEDRQVESVIRQGNTDRLAALVQAEIVTPEGARAAIDGNPDEYLPGLPEGIKAEALEAGAETGGEILRNRAEPERKTA
ncbi:MAG: DUF1073 domain-containing protein [Desulfovibrio sp.]|jgi:phage-related protein (TIGR01555 family)|nr:DUF1073 domain-containing protein [Desulfovibrio sp.]